MADLILRKLLVNDEDKGVEDIFVGKPEVQKLLLIIIS